MCCSSLTSAVNVAAIIASVRYVTGVVIGYFVCTAIDATQRTEVQDHIYSRLLLIVQNDNTDTMHQIIIQLKQAVFPWAVILTTLAGLLLLASFAMMYGNVRSETLPLAVWLFLSIIDTVVSPTSIGIYAYKYIHHKISKSKGQEQNDQITEVSAITGVTFVYYMVNMVLIGVTWKRYVQIKQDNDQKSEVPYTIPMDDYSFAKRLQPRHSRVCDENMVDCSNSTLPRHSSVYCTENDGSSKYLKYDDWNFSRHGGGRLSEAYYQNRKNHDNVYSCSNNGNNGRSYCYHNQAMIHVDEDDLPKAASYANSDVSIARDSRDYPPSDILSERRFSMYPAVEYTEGRKPTTYADDKGSSYFSEGDLTNPYKSPNYLFGNPLANRRPTQYLPNVDGRRSFDGNGFEGHHMRY